MSPRRRSLNDGKKVEFEFMQDEKDHVITGGSDTGHVRYGERRAG